MDIFSNSPITPVESSSTPDQNNTNLNTEVNSVTPITSSTPVNDFNQPINDLNNQFNINEPISSTPIITNPIQDQLLQSNSISQFDVNSTNSSSVENIHPITDQNINPTVSPTEDQPINNISSFMPEQPINDINSLSSTESQSEVNNNVPVTPNIEVPVQQINEPIIVSNDDNQFDPIMPEQQNNQPTLDFKTIINLVRQCSQTIEKCGYKIDTEEIDMGEKYQVTFTIDK